MKFKLRNSAALADLICGNTGADDPGVGEAPKYFPYRSSSYITEFFADLGTDRKHDGSTRQWWVADAVDEILTEPHEGPEHPPETFCRLIDQLMDPRDALNEGADRTNALAELNEILNREGYEAFYGDDRHCYLQHLASNTVNLLQANPHRPLTPAEVERLSVVKCFGPTVVISPGPAGSVYAKLRR